MNQAQPQAHLDDGLNPHDPANDGTKPIYFSVIREFQGKDTAALFGIMPPSNDVKLTGFENLPAFLGQPRVEVLTRQTLKKLFAHGRHSMSGSDRDAFFAGHNGALIVYFEGYDGRLCNDSPQTVALDTTVSDQPELFRFEFSAVATPRHDCEFRTLSLDTRE